ncbi:hypothetical protein F5146DRAFT_939626 [Armillaria mellea]|nr:hypothetical protein F5146DRAFT_939626 [Armillaria mellea]
MVVEVHEKHSELMAQAYNDCGHYGRDAVYRLLHDQFYWSNMFDDVTYFM